MGILDDVPLPQGTHLLLASAGLSTAAGGMSLLQPKKTHEYYFEEEVPGDDDKKEPAPQHKPTTRFDFHRVFAFLYPDQPGFEKVLTARD